MPGSILLQDNSNSGPITGGAVAITAGATEYDPPLRGLYLNASGVVALTFADGTTFTGTMAAGVIHPIAGIKVVSSAPAGTYAFKG